MSIADKQIAGILSTYGEPIVGNIWRVQGQAVIYHKALERIAATAKIKFDPPTVLRAERDEAVILVTGRMGDRAEWSIGEALVNVNYRVSGRQAAYVYAMAEKRGKDRVILKLIGLHGLLCSEEEADEFKTSAPPPPGEAERPAPVEPPPAPPPAPANVVQAAPARTEKRKLLHERAREKCHAGREAWMTWLAQLTVAQVAVVDEISDELNGILREQAVKRGETA